jgi:cell division protein FtsB
MTPADPLSRPAADAGVSSLRRGQSPWIRRALLFIVCALTVNALIGERSLAEAFRVRRQLERSAAALASLRRDNARLAEYADRLRNDPRTIEAIARGELGMIRKGEILVRVRDLDAR